jgi:hypothetical protein
MKKIFLPALIALAALTTLSSCQKDETVTDTQKPWVGNIVQIATSNPTLSSLAAAVVKTGLAGVLADPNLSVTVFAPTNQAFAKLPAPFNNATNISAITDSATIDALRHVLLYHVLGAEVFSNQIAAGRSSATTLNTGGSTNDSTIYISNAKSQILINGVARVQRADIDATNGVVHLVEDVILPPSQTIAAIAIANPNFSSLVAALVKTNLAGIFAAPGDFTVFAPVDSAFAHLPAPFDNAANISAITDTAQISALANILKYHVMGSRYFTWDLGNHDQIETLAAAPDNLLTTVQGFNRGLVKGNSNDDYIDISTANILATNGVIHVIGEVLLP